jgi:RNA polymerase sigma-70 factor (ECF subfamily)
MEPKRRPWRLPPVTTYASALNERTERPGAVVPGTDVGGVVLAFERFYATERLRIGRAVALSLGDTDLAAEATDEAFARAYERWSAIAGGNPGGWVYRVAMNWALSVLRRHRRRGPGVLYEQALESTAVHDPAVREPAVHAALAALDPKHRSVVVCRHLLGWSVADTAEALHLREGTVKSRLARANQILQSQLHHLRPEEQA